MLPTSLCSSQVAELYVSRITPEFCGPDKPLDRIIALPHTEGCGRSSDEGEAMFTRTMLGYALHPSVVFAVGHPQSGRALASTEESLLREGL